MVFTFAFQPSFKGPGLSEGNNENIRPRVSRGKLR